MTLRPRGRHSAQRSSPTPRRLVLLCEHYYPEMVSTGMHMTELATRLASMGWDITVYTARPSWGNEDGADVPREMTYDGVKIVRVPTLGSQKGTLVSKAIAGLTFVFAVSAAVLSPRARYDGLIVTTNPPFVGALAWLASSVYRRPYLVIVYDLFPDFAISLGALSPDSIVTPIWRVVTRAILSTAAVTVVIGRDMRTLVERKIPRRVHDRIALIPNWSDERRVHPVPRAENGFRREHVPSRRFVVQYAGRLGEKHPLEPLIQAAALTRESDVLFQFVGDGAKLVRLRAMAERLALDNVQFLPYQPMERLAEMLSAADVAVVSLEQGHTGISVPSKAYGVLASGTPIIGVLDPASEIGLMIAESGCGLVVQPDAHALADAIRELRDDPDRRRAMGDAARATFLRHYTLARAAERYDSAIRSMLGMDPVTRIPEVAPRDDLVRVPDVAETPTRNGQGSPDVVAEAPRRAGSPG